MHRVDNPGGRRQRPQLSRFPTPRRSGSVREAPPRSQPEGSQDTCDGNRSRVERLCQQRSNTDRVQSPHAVSKGTKCAFILPDKKLEKDKKGKKLLKHSTLEKIVKLPEKVFSEGVTASVFIFTAGVPQDEKEIFACYIEIDGLETVKNQGRQDIKDRWQEIEDRWVDIIHKQSGDNTIQWLKPSEHLSYQMPEKPLEIDEEDFTKTMMDYLMFKEGIDVKDFGDTLLRKIMYDSEITSGSNCISISVSKGGDTI